MEQAASSLDLFGVLWRLGATAFFVVLNGFFVPDTMAVSSFLIELQAKQTHCAVVLDERGTAIGLAFREDALEEIVGPLGDEFDEHELDLREIGGGRYELAGRMPLPELCNRLDFELGEDEGEDTIGGHLTARLGRLPRTGAPSPSARMSPRWLP
jgi:CBS domain containing-hemolysin-like protein